VKDPPRPNEILVAVSNGAATPDDDKLSRRSSERHVAHCITANLEMDASYFRNLCNYNASTVSSFHGLRHPVQTHARTHAQTQTNEMVMEVKSTFNLFIITFTEPG
jgi:hypothetical protein